MIILGLAALAITTADTTAVQAALQRAVVASFHAEMQWGEISDVRGALEAAYARRGWQALWSSGREVTVPARALISTLDSAASRGLDPRDYDLTWLHARVSARLVDSAAAIAEFDVVLSTAAARYLSALANGRIDPRVLHPTFTVNSKHVDLGASLAQMAETPRPDTLFRNAEPQHLTYQRLIQVLATYRGMQSGDVNAPDSVATRIDQIELALERWRWMPHSVDGPWILVNVPAFRLYAFGSAGDGEDLVRMNVVVGQAVTHNTPLLATNIVAVQFHPPWLVPSSIARREIRPAALRDSAFLRLHHYELLRGDSVIEPTVAAIRRIGAGVEVRQAVGPWNALGRIKFVTPNDADIYLHDTPERVDFLRAERDFSHGCIRVADPLGLSEFVFRHQPDWPPERFAALWEIDSTLTVPLTRRIPVFVIYQTIVPDDAGGTVVYPDIYGLDRRLAELLRSGYPYPVYLTATAAIPR
jgi:murein L,D-transpeptidase YcbB/YkuD